MSMHLSQAVCRLREHAGESQRDFARMLGMSFFSLQKYEHGGPQTPDPRLLVAFMATAMNQSRSDLAAVFERELTAALALPPGWKIVRSQSRRKRS